MNTPTPTATRAGDITVRALATTDHAAWLTLWRGYQNFYQTDIAADTTAETWHRLHDDAEPMWCAVATLADRLVGIVHYLTHRSTWTRGDYCYLQDLYVDPVIRARGIGRVLIGHVYQRAAEMGCSRVWWLTHQTNTDAMKLYDQVADQSGFIQYRKMLG